MAKTGRKGSESAKPRLALKSASKLEGALLRWRFPVGAVLLILILIDALSIGWTVLSGKSSPLPIPVPVTFSDEAQLLLALGTLALAYAAGLQALSAREQTHIAEKTRLANMRPLLSIKLMEPSETSDQKVSASRTRSTPSTSVQQEHTPQPQLTPLFVTEVKGAAELRFVLTNMGPGNATRVTVRGPYETLANNGPWLKTEFVKQVPGRLDPTEGWLFQVVEDWTLQANEVYEFTLPVATPSPKDTGAASGTYEVLSRLDLIAACKDVEGNTQRETLVSVRLHQIVPFSYQASGDQITDKIPGSGRGYRLAWSIVLL